MDINYLVEHDDDYKDFKKRDEKYANFSSAELDQEWEEFKKKFAEEHRSDLD